MSAASNTQNPIVVWLFFNALMVFAMVMIGAITRLTESGLSMVEWKPLIGALPPLNDAEWNRVFGLYQQTPEFQKVNFWMDLGDFKRIFFWEWLHRLWGRLIGLTFALPLLVFWIKGMVPKGYNLKFLGLLLLGGLQGFIGWYMVTSGLVDEPAVSHYRLALHLSIAFIIFGFLLWYGFALKPVARVPDRALWLYGLATLAFVGIAIVWGAFVAGLDAGLVYNEFPLMGGQIVPPDFDKYGSFFANITENHTGVQFFHRWIAVTAALVVLSFWLHAVLKGKNFAALHIMAAMVFVQVGLGIATLLSQVYLPLAAAHQAGALILSALVLFNIYKFKN